MDDDNGKYLYSNHARKHGPIYGDMPCSKLPKSFDLSLNQYYGKDVNISDNFGDFYQRYNATDEFNIYGCKIKKNQ